MNSNKITLIIIGIAVLTGLTPLMIEKGFVNDAGQTYNTSAKVVEYVEGNTTLGLKAGEGFAFGELSQGVNITKELRMSTESKGFVRVDTSGNISSYLDHDRVKSFRGNTALPIKFVADKKGFYEGKIYVKTSQPENLVAEKWLELKYLFYSF